VGVSDRRGHDPVAWRRVAGLGGDARDDVGVVDRVAEVDQGLGQDAEVHEVRMCVDQAGQHRRTLDVDLAGAIARGRLDLGLGADRDDLPLGLVEADRLANLTSGVTGDHRAAVQHDAAHAARDGLAVGF
jgi:hypothetical protein